MNLLHIGKKWIWTSIDYYPSITSTWTNQVCKSPGLALTTYFRTQSLLPRHSAISLTFDTEILLLCHKTGKIYLNTWTDTFFYSLGGGFWISNKVSKEKQNVNLKACAKFSGFLNKFWKIIINIDHLKLVYCHKKMSSDFILNIKLKLRIKFYPMMA